MRLNTAGAMRQLGALTSDAVKHMVSTPIGEDGLAVGVTGRLEGVNAIDTGTCGCRREEAHGSSGLLHGFWSLWDRRWAVRQMHHFHAFRTARSMHIVLSRPFTSFLWARLDRVLPPLLWRRHPHACRHRRRLQAAVRCCHRRVGLHRADARPVARGGHGVELLLQM